MSELEKNSWSSSKDLVKNFLGNKRAQNYTEIAQKLLQNYKALGCNMSIKLHFLHSHLLAFQKNLDEVSDEQFEKFHFDLKVIKERY